MRPPYLVPTMSGGLHAKFQDSRINNKKDPPPFHSIGQIMEYNSVCEVSLSDVQNWKPKMFSQTRGESLVYQQQSKGWKYELLFLRTVFVGLAGCEIFLRLRDEIFLPC